MMGTTHRTGSIALACGVIALCPMTSIPVAPAATFVVAAAIGGLFPDVDSQYSTYGRRFFILLFPFYLIRKIISLLGTVIKPLKKASAALQHRGLFHSPILWTIITLIIGSIFYFTGVTNMFAYAILLGAYLGIISHVILDYIAGGVPLLAPFTMKRFKPGLTIKTGGLLEVVFNVAFIGLAIYCASICIPKIVM